MKKLLLVLIIAARIGYFAYQGNLGSSRDSLGSSSHQLILDSFQNQVSSVQVSGRGVVTKILPDDNVGSRHQRFILELSSGHTLLMSHNIDLAPRISTLRIGDSIEFNGVCEWNSKGGVIHWTHHDPQGQHEPGWLKHKGRTYQ